ncbi:hypothetical protein Tsubulata_040245 [Turnera subulata]|uniref:Uncharacterized protein n=1 Tax=Turnera subulata TaxID=218843 RepID=A0A9Q0FBG0_9ROSI|nr:hypothetical protein Tsubulata_040245 [Turnera subulata]
MATTGQIPSTGTVATSTANNKPVILRVKRKSFQSPLDAMWLEINERPSKRAALDLEKLSITDTEFRAKKVFVKHVETVTSSDASMDLLQSFVTSSGDVGERKRKSKSEEQKRSFKDETASAINARFEQISIRGKQELSSDRALHDMCHFFDVVRIDMEESLSEDQKLLLSYLPLLQEFIPSAAAEVASGLSGYMPKAENHPFNEYPDEESDEEDEEQTEASNESDEKTDASNEASDGLSAEEEDGNGVFLIYPPENCLELIELVRICGS